MNISGLDSLCRFSFQENNNEIRTFITQEMLKKKILATNTVYLSIEHNDNVLDEYFERISKIFKRISKINTRDDIMNLLEYPVINSDFRRIN